MIPSKYISTPTAPISDDSASRFEEIMDEKILEIGMKRPRDSDEPDQNLNAKLSKKEKKKLKAQQAAAAETSGKSAESMEGPPSKKLKKESGEGHPTKTASNDQAESSGKKKDKKEKHNVVGGNDKHQKEEGKQKEAKKAEKDQETGQTKVHENGLKVTDAKIGTGPAAKKGSHLEIRYIGKLADGKVFDQNVKGKPVGSVPFD
jgi:FK506-binding nuclear protein